MALEDQLLNVIVAISIELCPPWNLFRLDDSFLIDLKV